MLPYPSSTWASGGPSIASTRAEGTTITDDSLTPVEKSSLTSRYLRSAACALILGRRAVMTEMPTIAYGSWKSCQA